MKPILFVLGLLCAAAPALAQTATPTLMSLPVGHGETDFSAFQVVSCRIDPASLNLGQSEEDICIVPGIKQGDLVVVYVPPSLSAALVHSGTRIISNNQVGIRISSLVNSTNDTVRDWQIVAFLRTQKVVSTPGPAPTVTASATVTATPVPTNTAVPTNTPP